MTAEEEAEIRTDRDLTKKPSDPVEGATSDAPTLRKDPSIDEYIAQSTMNVTDKPTSWPSSQQNNTR